MSEQTPTPEQAPTKEELELAASIISRLPKNGLWPKELFYTIAERVVMPIIEVVPLRSSDRGIQVLLLQRPDDDPNWPGQLHTPGTVLRTTDLEAGGLQSAFERIARDELQTELSSVPIPTGIDFHRVHRGPEMANVFSIDLSGVDELPGTWHNAAELPDNIVDTQRGFIEQAVKNFEKDNV